ncbi:MAG TPA: hypothetical protein VLL52_11940, partial [Anaerolineae bacterium]|nr:hypothetical protein [Anaerolineae bacterium]
YRTIQRFFYKPISWLPLFWQFFYHHLFDAQASYILVGDESVVTKAGHKTHGLDYFFSSLFCIPFLTSHSMWSSFTNE